MKYGFSILFMIFTHCTVSAQWVKIHCPVSADILCNHGGYIFVGSEGGLFRTSDFGETWLGVNKGLSSSTNSPEIAMIYSYDSILIIFVRYSGGLYRSFDNGTSWEILNNSFQSISAHQHGYLFARPVLGSHIMRSSDSGLSWKHIVDGLHIGRPPYKELYTAPALMNSILYTCNGGGEVCRSTNDGELWEKIYTHTPEKLFYIYTINDTTLFAFTPDTIFRSTTNGYSWQPIRVGLGNAHKVVVKDSLIVIRHGRAVSLSLNNGDSWRSINDNLPDYDNIDMTDLLISGDYLYLGTYSYGLWLRRLSTLSVSENKPQSEVSIYPNPSSGTVHIQSGEGIHSITITNILGEVVYQSTGRETIEKTIDLTGYPSGMYHCIIHNTSTALHRTIILRH